MKISILIPEDLVIQVHQHCNAKNRTESVCAVLKDWVTLKNLEESKKLKEREPEYLPGFERLNYKD